MVINSSSVMAPIAIGVEQAPHQLLEQAEQDGQRAQNHGQSTRRRGVAVMAQPSACSLAMVLGLISPKVRMTRVKTTVEMVAPYSGLSLVKNKVPRVAAVMLSNTIAHQKGGEQSVKIFSQAQGGLGLAVAVVRHIPQSDLVQRGKGGLGGGEVC